MITSEIWNSTLMIGSDSYRREIPRRFWGNCMLFLFYSRVRMYESTAALWCSKSYLHNWRKGSRQRSFLLLLQTRFHWCEQQLHGWGKLATINVEHSKSWLETFKFWDHLHLSVFQILMNVSMRMRINVPRMPYVSIPLAHTNAVAKMVLLVMVSFVQVRIVVSLHFVWSIK